MSVCVCNNGDGKDCSFGRENGRNEGRLTVIEGLLPFSRQCLWRDRWLAEIHELWESRSEKDTPMLSGDSSGPQILAEFMK